MLDRSASSPASFEPTPCHCLALRQAARQVTQIYDRELAQTGLRSSQYSILSNLHRRGPLPIGQLAAILVMERTAMGRAIRPLERDGLVAIAADDDGRRRIVKLTSAGRARLKSAEPRWRVAQRRFEDAYGSASAQALRAELLRLVTAV